MRIAIVKTKIYPFSELSKEAKEKAIENLRHINTNDDFWDNWLIEEWEEKLEKMGYDNPKILFSGFWSQGDGACFTADIDIEKYIVEHKLTKKLSKLLKYQRETENITGKITHNWRYYFATSSNVEAYDNGYNEKMDDQLEKFIQFIEKDRETLGNKIYKELESLYYELEKDAAIIETIEANDYEFTENGKMY